ncbi:MAG: type IV pilus modification protein PilV [Neisseriaceae bacterium]|nr:type IV pilus modification protein PilV [Neisseriaceae bacterium]
MNTTILSRQHLRREQGSTLIEVLVSMFILALGLMALISMQVRTSASIQESENMGIVAQATQNLAEAMLSNPKLTLDAASGVTKKDYSHYNAECEKDRGDYKFNNKFEGTSNHGKTIAGRNLLAAEHLNNFCTEVINNIRGGTKDELKIKTKVQKHKDSSGAELGQELYVTWKMSTSGDDSDGNKDVEYTYTYLLDDQL